MTRYLFRKPSKVKMGSNKSYDLELLPTLLLKSCINQLFFPINTIINLSI